MSLLLNEEQSMLRDSARDFLKAQAPVKQLRELRDQHSAQGFATDTWQKFAEMGFTGVLLPEAFGGMGLGHVEAGVIMEQMGHTLTASPLLASGIVCATALALAGNEDQKQVWCPKLANAKAIAGLAVDEFAKHRPQEIATLAHKEGAAWTLNGTKSMVLEAHVADLFIVAARLGPDADLGLFLVPSNTTGVTIERTAMVDAHNAGRVSFQSVKLEQSAALTINPQAALNAALDAGRCAAAAQLLGLADEVFERTVQYLKDRKQFGKAIGEFQALQHRAAELYCEIELTRATVVKAQQALDKDIHQAAQAVALAKSRAGQCANLAVQEGVQMHGGMGMTDAFDIGFFMKRARVLQELWGDANFHLNALATAKGY